jgi:two-component system CheB/CheR fusion protein
LNAALEARCRELQRVNSELVNVFNNMGIAMVMLGSDLRIRRFNAQATRFFNLQDSDIGKTVREIHPSISLPHLEEACLDVLDSFMPRSRQVQDAQGRNFSLFFRPYRTAESRVDGVILALLEGNLRLPPPALGD